MATTRETGHAKNVANFDALISFCTGYGATYNPSKASIQLAALNTLLASAQASLASHKVAHTSLANATNAREVAFKPLRKLATKSLNALVATDALQQTIDDARAHNLKLQGRRATAKPEARPAAEGQTIVPVATNSTSQQSFDGLVENFAKFIQTLSAEPLYKPNEADLQVATLNSLIADLKVKNKVVIDAATTESNARIDRDKVLYNEDTGLHDIAQSVKAYVKSIYTAASPQYRQVSKIKFKGRPN